MSDGNKPGRKRPDVRSMIKKVAEETREALSSKILAPVVPGAKVRVRISSIVYEMQPDDSTFEGWAVLQASGAGQAVILGTASPAQIKMYLELLPRFQLVTLLERDGSWWGIPAQTSDRRVQVSGPVRMRLANRVSSFETVDCRFDGTAFWFEEIARRRNPVIARRLRDALADDVLPDDLQVLEMVPQERVAYSLVFFSKHPELLVQEPSSRTEARSETKHEEDYGGFDYQKWLQDLSIARLTVAVEHAGGRLDGYWKGETGTVTVRMLVDDKPHVVTVRNKDMTVLSSGICLSGQDEKFDLSSLVGVLREHNTRM